MRSVRFLPLAFIAGVHGFVIFAPYAAFMLLAGALLRGRLKSR